MTVIYVDVLFAENFIINYLLLFASARLGGMKLKRWRMLLSSLLGAIYSVFIFLPHMKLLSSLPFKLAVGVAMALICYAGLPNPLRSTLLFFFTSFAFGGCALAVGFITGGAVMQNGIFMPVSVKAVAISLLLTFAILIPVFGRLAKHGGTRRDTAECIISMFGNTVNLTALIDTGNTLTDPLTGAMVIVANLQDLKPLLGASVTERVRRYGAIEAFEELGSARYRLIPYQTVGSDCSFLLAFKPDSVNLAGKEIRGALVAMSPTPVSDGSGYNALAGVS